jgi:glycerol-3-phosphate acyltransferase PlsY
MTGLILVLAYLIGAIPFSVVVGRTLGGVDVRRAGSGNTGAMNTLRTAGPLLGVLVAVLDAAKAALAVVLGTHWLGAEVGALAGCAAVAGHCFSPYLIATSWNERGGGWKMALRRTGGKGLASGMGVLVAVAWQAAVVGLMVFALTYALQRKDDTLPAVVGCFSAVPAMWYFTGNVALAMAALLVVIIIAVKHLPDLRAGYYVDSKE